MFPTADTEDILQVTSLTTKLGATSDAQNSTENTQVATQQSNRDITLKMLIKEMIFCLALALTTYGALHNSPTKISKHPQATRFFRSDSIVQDWYRGQLTNVLASVNRVDVSFVMYYAPWDAESQYVRGEFEKAALILHDRVQFAAINCWNPGSECRLHNNKISSWPILMAYTSISTGIFYYGPRDAHSMVNFLELMIKPLRRVSSSEDLVNLLSRCDAVAVGYTPLTETAKYYNVWHTVALKAREADVIGEICFAAVTSEELAAELGVESVPNARLMLWNDTKEYISRDGDLEAWNQSSLIHWVLDNFSQPVARIVPLWRKSFNFERYVNGNPILILFTPLNPLYEQLPSYSLLREVAMEYYNCKNKDTSHWTSELVKLQQVQRLLYQQKNYTKFCNEFKFKKPVRKQNRLVKKGVESQNNKYPWYNSTNKHQKNGIFNFLLKRGFTASKAIESVEEGSQWLSSLDWLQDCGMKALPAERSFYEHYEQCQTLEESFSPDPEETPETEEIETTMLPFEDDPLSSENLLEDSVNHFCKVLRFAHEWGPPIYPTGALNIDERRTNITHIDGMSCARNFSLQMIAIDSVRNHHFAESLGIDITNKKDMTAVVILDNKHESQFLLSEEYNAKSIREFISNFTNKSLKRSLRSHVYDTMHTHYFGSDGTSEQMGISENSVYIEDLTSRTFRRMVKTPGMMSLVAVCGGACSARVSRALVGARRLLAGCGLRLRLARLDALRHDLPWHYTVHHYPTLLVFPAHRRGEADSESYPGEARITSAGAVALALRSLAAPEHLRVRIALCAAVLSHNEKKTCLKDIKEHATSVINKNLRHWRQIEDRELKEALFKRLQHLHTLALDLSLFHVTDLSENSVKQVSLSNTLSVLSKNWDINTSALRKNANVSSLSKTS
ncbi:thioredoxin domain-containing protein 11 [Spodoptera litura]|uniref:Thioredoxin domain-containing protein 11 n=1 Tax=Spodoptera litura TaxID=69820 RepID=A0A9J7EGY3_SPOLT|nr:thioredoxin domain-containing protein 11 [Spodoptera litura]